MKRFFSSPAPKFNKWMTVCALGVTLLGLPMTAVAQDAVAQDGVTQDGSSSSVMTSDKGAGRGRKLYVNNTQWMVEIADNGRNGDYHPVPWSFSPDGTVHAGNLWQGVWRVKSNNTISVTIRMNGSSAIDQFDVKFISSSEFTAYKNGHAYRYGVRS